MHKSSSRALIFDENKNVYLITHFYVNPDNDGKWSTVGGRREDYDSSDLDCLKREILEEFGQRTLDSLRILSKLGEFSRKCEINNSDEVTHHFFHCELLPGRTISPALHQNEVKDGKFFSLDEVKEIEEAGGFVLGCEAKMLKEAYSRYS